GGESEPSRTTSCGLSRTRYSWCSILPRKSPRHLSGGTIRRCQPPGPRAPEAPCRECLRRARHAGKRGGRPRAAASLCSEELEAPAIHGDVVRQVPIGVDEDHRRETAGGDLERRRVDPYTA